MSDQDKPAKSVSDPVSEVNSEELTPERFREIILDLEVAKKKEIEQRIFSESLVNGLKILTSADSANSIFLNLLTSLKDVLSFDTAMILKKGRGCLYNTIITTDPKFKDTVWKEGKVFTRLMKGKPIIINSVGKTSEWSEKKEELKFCPSSILYIPIISKKNHVIFSFLKRDSSFSNSHKELALKIIPLVTSALMNAEKNDLIKKKTDELELEKIGLEMLYETYYEQKKSRDLLLGSLNQGYLTFNREGIIQEGTTKITEELLETSFFESEVKKLKVWDVLFKKKEQNENFKKWIDKIFEGRFSFKDLKQLAPKSFEGSKGKYIELEFRPIYEEESKRKIDKVIMIASDKTHELELENKLSADKENIEFVSKCLQNPLEFVDLIFDTTSLIHEFKFEKNSLDKGELFRKFHTTKARFGQFSLKSLTTIINDVETAISLGNLDKMESSVEKFDLELKEFVKRNRLIVEAANKFLVDEGNAVQVPEIIEKAQSFEDINQYIEFVKNEYLLTDLKTKFERYIPLVNEIAESQGKTINVEISGDKVLVDTNKYSNFINSSIHLFRNMVDHGIESEDERIEKAKPQKGEIKVDFKLNGGNFELVIQDDGQGIDPDRIREKAIEKGLKSEKELAQIKDEQIMDMIFMPGLSTKEEVTDVSGRGVGMDAVRDEVNKLKGEISVSSKIDEGTKFVIKLPVLS